MATLLQRGVVAKKTGATPGKPSRFRCEEGGPHKRGCRSRVVGTQPMVTTPFKKVEPEGGNFTTPVDPGNPSDRATGI